MLRENENIHVPTVRDKALESINTCQNRAGSASGLHFRDIKISVDSRRADNDFRNCSDFPGCSVSGERSTDVDIRRKQLVTLLKSNRRNFH